jgi:hypothetical protein
MMRLWSVTVLFQKKGNSGDENASFFTHPNPTAELEVKTDRFLSSLRCDRNDD